MPEKVEFFLQQLVLDNVERFVLDTMTNDSDIFRKTNFQLAQIMVNIVIHFYDFDYNGRVRSSLQLDVEDFLLLLLKKIAFNGSKNLLKMSEYFQFFNEFIGYQNRFNRSILIQNDMISIFVDYYLQKDSPVSHLNECILDVSNKFINFTGLLHCVISLGLSLPEPASHALLTSHAFFKKTIASYPQVLAPLLQAILVTPAAKTIGELLLQQLNALNGDDLFPYLHIFQDYIAVNNSPPLINQT